MAGLPGHSDPRLQPLGAGFRPRPVPSAMRASPSGVAPPAFIPPPRLLAGFPGQPPQPMIAPPKPSLIRVRLLIDSTRFLITMPLQSTVADLVKFLQTKASLFRKAESIDHSTQQQYTVEVKLRSVHDGCDYVCMLSERIQVLCEDPRDIWVVTYSPNRDAPSAAAAVAVPTVASPSEVARQKKPVRPPLVSYAAPQSSSSAITVTATSQKVDPQTRPKRRRSKPPMAKYSLEYTKMSPPISDASYSRVRVKESPVSMIRGCIDNTELESSLSPTTKSLSLKEKTPAKSNGETKLMKKLRVKVENLLKEWEQTDEASKVDGHAYDRRALFNDLPTNIEAIVQQIAQSSQSGQLMFFILDKGKLSKAIHNAIEKCLPQVMIVESEEQQKEEKEKERELEVQSEQVEDIVEDIEVIDVDALSDTGAINEEPTTDVLTFPIDLDQSGSMCNSIGNGSVSMASDPSPTRSKKASQPQTPPSSDDDDSNDQSSGLNIPEMVASLAQQSGSSLKKTVVSESLLIEDGITEDVWVPPVGAASMVLSDVIQTAEEKDSEHHPSEASMSQIDSIMDEQSVKKPTPFDFGACKRGILSYLERRKHGKRQVLFTDLLDAGLLRDWPSDSFMHIVQFVRQLAIHPAADPPFFLYEFRHDSWDNADTCMIVSLNDPATSKSMSRTLKSRFRRCANADLCPKMNPNELAFYLRNQVRFLQVYYFDKRGMDSRILIEPEINLLDDLTKHFDSTPGVIESSSTSPSSVMSSGQACRSFLKEFLDELTTIVLNEGISGSDALKHDPSDWRSLYQKHCSIGDSSIAVGSHSSSSLKTSGRWTNHSGVIEKYALSSEPLGLTEVSMLRVLLHDLFQPFRHLRIATQKLKANLSRMNGLREDEKRALQRSESSSKEEEELSNVHREMDDLVNHVSVECWWPCTFDWNLLPSAKKEKPLTFDLAESFQSRSVAMFQSAVLLHGNDEMNPLMNFVTSIRETDRCSLLIYAAYNGIVDLVKWLLQLVQNDLYLNRIKQHSLPMKGNLKRKQILHPLKMTNRWDETAVAALLAHINSLKKKSPLSFEDRQLLDNLRKCEELLIPTSDVGSFSVGRMDDRFDHIQLSDGGDLESDEGLEEMNVECDDRDDDESDSKAASVGDAASSKSTAQSKSGDIISGDSTSLVETAMLNDEAVILQGQAKEEPSSSALESSAAVATADLFGGGSQVSVMARIREAQSTADSESVMSSKSDEPRYQLSKARAARSVGGSRGRTRSFTGNQLRTLISSTGRKSSSSKSLRSVGTRSVGTSRPVGRSIYLEEQPTVMRGYRQRKGQRKSGLTVGTPPSSQSD